jgi:hypothetical protein
MNFNIKIPAIQVADYESLRNHPLQTQKKKQIFYSNKVCYR